MKYFISNAINLNPNTKIPKLPDFAKHHTTFLANINSENVPKSFVEANQNPKWITAMQQELDALENNDT